MRLQPKPSDSPHPAPAESAKATMDFNYQSKNHALTFTPSHIPTFSPLYYPKFKIKNPRTSTSRERGEKLQQSHRLMAAFTLIELMAATTVLSVVLLMMVGMQDQMSKAWANANRRTDATREARAASLLMARDLSTFLLRGKTFSRFDSFQTNLTNAAVPFFITTNGSGGIAPGGAPNSAQFFGLIPQPTKGNDPADVALVGYYIALATNTNVSGFTTTSWNLFRYYIAPSNAAAGIAAWLSAPNGTATTLFTNIATNSEILARNACNLQIIIYGSTTATSGQITNGLNFSNNGSSSGFYRGNKLGLELSLYPEDVAQKITNSLWMNTVNIQKYARSFEFKIDCPKN